MGKVLDFISNYEIIIAVFIAVAGWLVNHWLTIRAQNRQFKNRIINQARIEITKELDNHISWLFDIYAEYSLAKNNLMNANNMEDVDFYILNKCISLISEDRRFSKMEANKIVFDGLDKVHKLFMIKSSTLSNQLLVLKVNEDKLSLQEMKKSFVSFKSKDLFDLINMCFDLSEAIQQISLSTFFNKKIVTLDIQPEKYPKIYADKKTRLQIVEPS